MKIEIDYEGLPLIVEGSYYAGCKERGEQGFCLGTPAEPKSFSIQSVSIRPGALPAEIHDWLASQCLELCVEGL